MSTGDPADLLADLEANGPYFTTEYFADDAHPDNLGRVRFQRPEITGAFDHLVHCDLLVQTKGGRSILLKRVEVGKVESLAQHVIATTNPELWGRRVQALVDRAHEEDWGGKHRTGFCEACADVYLVAMYAVPGGPRT